MSLDKHYLDYPMRRYGHDHERFDWNMLADRRPVNWPGNKRLAVWINTSLQFYPLNQKGIPFKVPNGMAMPYPDLRHFTLRDYGNRVGIYLFLKAFARYDIKPTFAISSQLALETPYLLEQLKATGGEFICHGWNMDHLHYGGQDRNEEAELVKRSTETLRELVDSPVRGWLSPAKNQSWHTPDLLAENGLEFCCDWVNDDMPYPFRTEHGLLTMMPLSTELEDQFIIGQNLHSEDSWVEQVKDAFDFLLQESEHQGGRMLALNIHPWMLGQPHRISSLEAVLDYITSHDEVWQVTASEIVDEFLKQSGTEAQS